MLALPKQYERERRFVNLMRQHDKLRRLSDDEYDRYIHYMESSSNLVLDVMHKEKAANATSAKPSAADKPKAKSRPKRKAAPKKASSRSSKRAPVKRSDTH